MDVPSPPPLDLNITVQQFMSLMRTPIPLPGSMPETPVMRSIMCLMQIVNVAQNIDHANLNRINCITEGVMASVVKMNGEEYKFSPVVKNLLTTKGVFCENPLESSMLEERLFRKVDRDHHQEAPVEELRS